MRRGSRLGRAWPTLFVVCVIGASFPLLAGSSAADAPADACALDSGSGVTTCTFASTGAEQTFTVPAGVTSLHVAAVGGLGGRYYNAYGPGPGSGTKSGASVSADLSVTPGALLYVEVGGNGGESTYFIPTATGGFNGGADGGTGTFNGSSPGNSLGGAGGGGASDVRTSPRSSALNPDTRLLVAAGGGGGAGGTGIYDFFGEAGFGGAAGTAGNDGYYGGGGGGAGTSSGVGGAGNPDNPVNGASGGDGTLGSGGAGGGVTFPGTYFGGGGGGGGLYGGGGGGSNRSGGGGGGGSSYSSGSNVVITTAGTGPSIVISYTVSAVPPGAPRLGGVSPLASASATVRFTPPSDTGTGPITGYEVTCGARTQAGTASPITVTGLTNGVSVQCTVRAQNEAAFGDPSAPASFVPGVPWGPFNIKGGPGPVKGSVMVNWTAAQSNGAAVTKYLVTCVPWNASFPTRSTVVSGSARSAQLNNLAPGQAHACSVVATNSRGPGNPQAAQPVGQIKPKA